MKKNHLLPLFFLLTVIFSFKSVFVADTAEKEFAKKIFESLKKGDEASFMKLVITQEEFAVQIDKASWDVSKKNSMKQRLTQDKLTEISKKNYQETREKAAGLKIKWEKAIIDSVSVQTKIKEGLENFCFSLYFSENKIHYYLTADKCLQTANGWKMANGANLYPVTK